MTVVEIKSTGGDVLMRRDLLRFTTNLQDLGPALDVAGDVLRQATRRQFESEGGYASGGWPQLAESTVAKRGSAHPILRVTDTLYDSLVSKFDPAHREIKEVSPSGASLRFGSTVPYLAFHQSTAPRSKIPYRPPIALTEADKRVIVKGMQAAMLAGVRGAARL